MLASCTAVHLYGPFVLHYFNVVRLYFSTFPVLSLYPYFIKLLPEEIAKPCLASLCLSVCLSASVTVTLTGRDFLNFSSWINQEFPWLTLNLSFHYEVQYSCHLFIRCVRSVHSTMSHLISLRSSGLVFSHLSFVPPGCLFLLGLLC